jgi:hypothetical protein
MKNDEWVKLVIIVSWFNLELAPSESTQTVVYRPESRLKDWE